MKVAILLARYEQVEQLAKEGRISVHTKALLSLLASMEQYEIDTGKRMTYESVLKDSLQNTDIVKEKVQ